MFSKEFTGSLGGPLYKPCSVSSVQLFKTSLWLEQEGPWRIPGGSLEVPGGSLGFPGGSLEIPQGPWRSLEGPWRIPGGSLGVPGGPLGAPWSSLKVPGGSLGGPWGSLEVPWGAPWRSLKVPWRLPGTNLVQSVQFSCSLEGPWGVPGGPPDHQMLYFSSFRGGPWIQTLFSQFSSVVQNTTGAEYQQRWFQKSASRSIPVTETANQGTAVPPAGIQIGSSGGTILALLEPFRGTLC